MECLKGVGFRLGFLERYGVGRWELFVFIVKVRVVFMFLRNWGRDI